MYIKDLDQFADYKQFEEPIQFKGFEAVGYFPYETASIKGCVPMPRNVFSEIENILSRTRFMDNKIVVVFRDVVQFGTEDFAINFKDASAKVGSIDDIIGYGGRELKLK